MKADIILNDEDIEITGSPVVVKGFFELKDDSGKLLLRINKRNMTLYNLDIECGKTKMLQQGIMMSERFSGQHIYATKLDALKITANEIELSPTADESAKASKIVVRNLRAEAVITLDGEKGDIVLKAFGSLNAKIEQMSRDINFLQSEIKLLKSTKRSL